MSYNYSTITSQEKFNIISSQIKSFEIQHYRNSLSLIEMNAVLLKDLIGIENLINENLDIEKKISMLNIELDSVSKLLPEL